ncbi:hypothetical protein ACFLZH_06025 [Patescibacteria group bacterium]
MAEFKRMDELYRLQSNEKTRSITNLTPAEVLEYSEEFPQGLINNIEGERKSLAILQNLDPSQIAPRHDDLFKMVKQLLRRNNMNGVEVEMLLSMEVEISDREGSESETHTVNEWLKPLKKKLKAGLKEGGYELTEEDKKLIRAVLYRSIYDLYKQRIDEGELSETVEAQAAEIEALREQVARLTNQIEVQQHASNTFVDFPDVEKGELPLITDEMRDIARAELGEWAEEYDVDSIEALYDSGAPTFSIGLMQAYYNSDQFNPTWENAWAQFILSLKHLVFIKERDLS